MCYDVRIESNFISNPRPSHIAGLAARALPQDKSPVFEFEQKLSGS